MRKLIDLPKFIMETMNQVLRQFKRKLRVWNNIMMQKESIAQVSENVEQFDLTKNRTSKNKKNCSTSEKWWINEYVKDYNDTEASAYAIKQIVKMKI